MKRRVMAVVVAFGLAGIVTAQPASGPSSGAVTGQAFWFLTLWGLGAMFEIVTRPAVTAVLRVNYPVDQRGHATGRISVRILN